MGYECIPRVPHNVCVCVTNPICLEQKREVQTDMIAAAAVAAEVECEFMCMLKR